MSLYVTYFVLLISAVFYLRQESVGYDISLMECDLENARIQREKETMCFERSLDLFYLPLLSLLSCCDSDIVDFVNLNDVNCHRYLAKRLS